MAIRTRIVGALTILLLGVVFLAGYWPEHQRRRSAERESVALSTRMTALDDRFRAAQLHAELLNLIDAVEAMNYGQAQTQSSALFDWVRAESARTSDPTLKTVLGEILAERDSVTASLAKGDMTALERLHASERKLRTIMSAPESR
jgi:hypothetical protein